MHCEEFGLNRRLDSGQQAGVIYGAERLQTVRRLGYQGVGAGLFGRSQQFFQELVGDAGHVASHHQIPFGGGSTQSGMEASQRPAPCDEVGNYRKTKVSIDFRRPDQRDTSSRLENLLGDRLNKGGPFPRQQRFVLAHAGTLASGQHKPRPAAWHEKMVAIAGSMSTNKKVYICFITALAMILAASPARAANSPGTESSSQKVSQKTLVVRADPRTGKLVRSVAPGKTSPAAKALPSIDISEMVEKAAHDNNVDPLLVHSIIQVESNYNPYAVSPKGAQGLMQLMPPTARDLGVRNSFDPRQNIEAGVRYLKYLQDMYQDDRLALAAYNAGPGAVEKYKWIPPYPETQDYVNRVGQQYGAAKKAAAQHLAEPAAPPVGVMEGTHPKLEPFVDAEGRLHLRTTQQ
jgi:hypothetical protein